MGKLKDYTLQVLHISLVYTALYQATLFLKLLMNMFRDAQYRSG